MDESQINELRGMAELYGPEAVMGAFDVSHPEGTDLRDELQRLLMPPLTAGVRVGLPPALGREQFGPAEVAAAPAPAPRPSPVPTEGPPPRYVPFAEKVERFGRQWTERLVREFPADFRRPMTRQFEAMLPTPPEARQLIQDRNWKEIGRLSLEGVFPTQDEIGTDFVAVAAQEIRASLPETKARATLNMLSRAVAEPASSRVRNTLARGDFPAEFYEIIPREWVAKHPKAALIPLALTSPMESLAYDMQHPERWPALAIWVVGAHYVLGPATKAGFAWLGTKQWATEPLGKVTKGALGKVLAKRTRPLTIADLARISAKDPGISETVVKAWAGLTSAQRRAALHAIKAGKTVRVVQPHFGLDPTVRGIPRALIREVPQPLTVTPVFGERTADSLGIRRGLQPIPIVGARRAGETAVRTFTRPGSPAVPPSAPAGVVRLPAEVPVAEPAEVLPYWSNIKEIDGSPAVWSGQVWIPEGSRVSVSSPYLRALTKKDQLVGTLVSVRQGITSQEVEPGVFEQIALYPKIGVQVATTEGVPVVYRMPFSEEIAIRTVTEKSPTTPVPAEPAAEVPAEAPAPRELSTVEQARLATGDRVLAPVMLAGKMDMRAGTVVDTSDPALVVVELDAGGRVKAGRARLRPVPEPAEEMPIAPTGPAQVKQSWQMTQRQFLEENIDALDQHLRDEQLGRTSPMLRARRQQHKERVLKALSEGKPVPAEVLADYPDLAVVAPAEAPAPAKDVEALTSLGYNDSQIARMRAEEAVRVLKAHIPGRDASVKVDGTVVQIPREPPEPVEAPPRAKLPPQPEPPSTPDPPGMTDADLDTVTGDAEPQLLRGALSLRGGRLSDEQIVASLGSALGKPKQTAAAIQKFGATEMLDRTAARLEAPEPPAAPVDELIERNAEQLLRRMTEKDQLGALTIRRGEPQPEIQDPIVRAAIVGARRTTKELTRGGAVNWAKDFTRDLKDILTAEFEPDLVRAGEVQFRDDYRTGALPIGMRAVEKRDAAFAGVWGDLTKDQRKTALNLIALEDFAETGGQGLTLMGDLTPDQVIRALDQLRGEAEPAVVEAVGRYFELAQTVGQEMVRRGKLPASAVRARYMPHAVLDFAPPWFTHAPFRPRRYRLPLRPYTKKRVGSAREIAISEDAIYAHYAMVFADNMYDDWGMAMMKKNDVLPQLNEDQKLQLFGQGKRPKPRGVYDIAGKRYRGFQLIPGNVLYRAWVANPKLLRLALEDAALDVDRLLTKEGELDIDALLGGMGAEPGLAARVSRTPQEQDAILDSYLRDVGPRGGDAIRAAAVVGRYQKTYLVPEAIYNKMMRFKDPSGAGNLVYDVIGAVGMWKRATLSLFAAGLPFQMGNLGGDFINLYRTSPGAAKMGVSAFRILMNMSTHKGPLTRQLYGPHRLNPFQREVLQMARDKDVLGSGFFREWASGRLITSPKGLWEKMERLSALREGWLRVAMLAHQWDRYKSGLGFHAPEFQRAIEGLDPPSAAAFIAREFTVDYMAVPDFYRKYVRGIAFPFMTFWQKNAQNWALYARHAPARFTGKVIAPIVGAWAYNNTVMRDVEEKLGYFRRRTFHINIAKFDDDDDGIADRALIFAPQIPTDMAAEWLGFNLLPEKITLVRGGYMTAKEAAVQQLWDMGLGTPKLLRRLTGPMVKVVDGIATNRDPFTKREIVPSELEGAPVWDKKSYWLKYLATEFVTPFGQYMRGLSGSDLSLLEEATGITASKWLRPVLRGPLDVARGAGFYIVDLRVAEAREFGELGRKARGKFGKYRTRLKDAFVRSHLDPVRFLRTEQATRILETAARDGVYLDAGVDAEKAVMREGSMVRWLSSSLPVLIEWQQEAVRSERNPKRRKELNANLARLLQLRAAEFAAKAPTAVRPGMFEYLWRTRRPEEE